MDAAFNGCVTLCRFPIFALYFRFINFHQIFLFGPHKMSVHAISHIDSLYYAFMPKHRQNENTNFVKMECARHEDEIQKRKMETVFWILQFICREEPHRIWCIGCRICRRMNKWNVLCAKCAEFLFFSPWRFQPAHAAFIEGSFRSLIIHKHTHTKWSKNDLAFGMVR